MTRRGGCARCGQPSRSGAGHEDPAVCIRVLRRELRFAKVQASQAAMAAADRYRAVLDAAALERAAVRYVASLDDATRGALVRLAKLDRDRAVGPMLPGIGG